MVRWMLNRKVLTEIRVWATVVAKNYKNRKTEHSQLISAEAERLALSASHLYHLTENLEEFSVPTKEE